MCSFWLRLWRRASPLRRERPGNRQRFRSPDRDHDHDHDHDHDGDRCGGGGHVRPGHERPRRGALLALSGDGPPTLARSRRRTHPDRWKGVRVVGSIPEAEQRDADRRRPPTHGRNGRLEARDRIHGRDLARARRRHDDSRFRDERPPNHRGAHRCARAIPGSCECRTPHRASASRTSRAHSKSRSPAP